MVAWVKFERGFSNVAAHIRLMAEGIEIIVDLGKDIRRLVFQPLEFRYLEQVVRLSPSLLQ